VDFRTYWINDKTSRDTVDWKPASPTETTRRVGGEETAYVHSATGRFRCFDLLVDPTWRTECDDLDRVLAGARSNSCAPRHLEREFTDMLLRTNRPGRWPSA